MTRFAALIAAVALVGVFSASALAATPNPDNPAGREILGVVPPHNFASRGGGGPNLGYHGGPVLHGEKTFAIYWLPQGYTMSANYQSLINGFLGNVATANASGWTGDTYFNDTQYSDGAGLISFGTSSFGGSYVDTNSFPANGCTDNVSQTSVCLSDAQIVNEIKSVISGNHAPAANGSTIYFMFTPKGVGSCYDSADCAFSQYCAYHSNFSSGVGLYANQPYTGTVPSACGSGQTPNNDSDADSTISVTSHEHNEAITDPLGSAWFDNRGYEDADKCAWTFGSSSQFGGTSGHYWNQTINGAHYYLQRNWSNRSSGCVLTGL